MLRGILAIITASILFGITPSGIKYVLLSGMTSDCVLFYQAIIIVLGTALAMVVRHVSFRISCKAAAKLMILGVVGMGCTDFLLNSAYGYLQVSTVLMLHFMYPSIVLILSAVIFRQRITKFSAGAIILSIMGLALITGKTGSIHPIGALCALGSALTYAIFAVANDKGDVNRYPLVLKLFYMSLGTSVVYGAKTFLCGNFSIPVNAKTAVILVGVVGIGSMLGFYFVTDGIKRIGAGRAAFINMLEPVTGVLGGVMIYHETLTSQAGIGCASILAAVLLVAFDGVHREKAQK